MKSMKLFRVLAVQADLSKLAYQLASGALARHEAVEAMLGLAHTLASVYRDAVQSQTDTQRRLYDHG